MNNVNPILDYKDMYNWTNDIPVNTFNVFFNMLQYIKNKNKDKDKIEILEIGTYTGTSIIKILELLPNSKATVIDKWKNYDENALLSVMEENNIEKIFFDNITKVGLNDRITAIKGDSFDILLDLINDNKKYDFIYVDGSHKLLDCHVDILLSFKLLNKGGIMAMDDYPYLKDTIFESPFHSINHFLHKFEKKINILNFGYRVFIEKISD